MNSTRSSIISLPRRRGSVNSVLSFAERRAFQSGRRWSDVSLEFTDKPSRSSVNNSHMFRRDIIFSPIHEHGEEVADSEMKENAHNLTCLDSSMKIMILSEEPKATITSPMYLKCTEV